MPLSQGQVLNNRYRIVRLLGQGGFGAVYRAWDLQMEEALRGQGEPGYLHPGAGAVRARSPAALQAQASQPAPDASITSPSPARGSTW